MSENLTYNVRAGDWVADREEPEARAVLAHAQECPGCEGTGAFHRSDLYRQPGLMPAQAFPLNLPTGAVLYPSSLPTRPVAERVAAVLVVLRRVKDRGMPLMRAAVAGRIARLEAYRPQ